MDVINYRTIEEYEAGVKAIEEVGVDYEGQRDCLTIIADELEPEEYDKVSRPCVKMKTGEGR